MMVQLPESASRLFVLPVVTPRPTSTLHLTLHNSTTSLRAHQLLTHADRATPQPTFFEAERQQQQQLSDDDDLQAFP